MNIKDALIKIKEIFPGTDPDYLLERLFTFPEGEWFEPRNDKANDYTICEELYSHHLIAKMVIPLTTKDGRRSGTGVFFYYRKDLQFDKSPILVQPATLFD